MRKKAAKIKVAGAGARSKRSNGGALSPETLRALIEDAPCICSRADEIRLSLIRHVASMTDGSLLELYKDADLDQLWRRLPDPPDVGS